MTGEPMTKGKRHAPRGPHDRAKPHGSATTNSLTFNFNHSGQRVPTTRLPLRRPKDRNDLSALLSVKDQDVAHGFAPGKTVKTFVDIVEGDRT